ncbi:hypothetical protein [Bradyrhizobium sp. STM 3809]|uniref:hypothetical protein n=1 Tax=Bradyrhizobium sp. STM 3809 TaxID=551936 RepID=UPI0002407607|nr:hypothetical protein [Bradyrhizobium sp. STM 3809]CCD97762.1 hypothetical protein BRAS3809_1320002 [Bradyrhizobium sp. STM 3809]
MTIFPGTDNWRQGMQEVCAAIDETFGELVEVTPAIAPKPNFPTEVLPEKAVTVTAVFTQKAETVIMGKEHHVGGHSLSPLVSTSKPVFQFGYGVLPFPMQQGYRIMRLCSGELFEATDVRPDGVARIVVPVVQLGRQKEQW